MRPRQQAKTIAAGGALSWPANERFTRGSGGSITAAPVVVLSVHRVPLSPCTTASMSSLTGSDVRSVSAPNAWRLFFADSVTAVTATAATHPTPPTAATAGTSNTLLRTVLQRELRGIFSSGRPSFLFRMHSVMSTSSTGRYWQGSSRVSIAYEKWHQSSRRYVGDWTQKQDRQCGHRRQSRRTKRYEQGWRTSWRWRVGALPASSRSRSRIKSVMSTLSNSAPGPVRGVDAQGQSRW